MTTLLSDFDTADRVALLVVFWSDDWPADWDVELICESADRRDVVSRHRDVLAAVLRRQGWTYAAIAAVVHAYSSAESARQAARRGEMHDEVLVDEVGAGLDAS